MGAGANNVTSSCIYYGSTKRWSIFERGAAAAALALQRQTYRRMPRSIMDMLHGDCYVLSWLTGERGYRTAGVLK
jgi:hypothetical protein